MSSLTQLLADRVSEVLPEPDEPDVIGIEDEAAGEVFSALASDTTRSILAAVYEEPQTASEIADSVNSSLQNVNYHLNKLTESDLIRVVETRYSDQGKEMNVYAPSKQAVVLFASDDLDRSSLRRMITRLLGAIGLFALISVLVDLVIRSLTPVSTGSAGGAGGAGGMGSAGGAAGTGGGVSPHPGFPIPPGVIFFAGCLLALIVLTVWQQYRAP